MWSRVVGNPMVTLIGLSSHPHTPMYYFLTNLSYIDLCHSTVVTPKMLVNFGGQSRTSFPILNAWLSCISSLFLLLQKCHMLAAMAYDRYAAICNPFLLYNATMSYHICFCLTVGVYILAIIDPQSIQDLCWDSFSARTMWLTIISVISSHSLSYPVPTSISTNYWSYSWVHLTSWLLP